METFIKLNGKKLTLNIHEKIGYNSASGSKIKNNVEIDISKVNIFFDSERNKCNSILITFSMLEEENKINIVMFNKSKNNLGELLNNYTGKKTKFFRRLNKHIDFVW